MGFHFVSHHEKISTIKKAKGVAMADIFSHFGTPTAKLKINPTKKKMKLIPNKWICDDLVSV